MAAGRMKQVDQTNFWRERLAKEDRDKKQFEAITDQYTNAKFYGGQHRDIQSTMVTVASPLKVKTNMRAWENFLEDEAYSPPREQ